MANPTLLDMPIAVNGTKNTIPATTADPGFATQNAGFPTETSLPLNQGGIAPSREDFNGLFNLVSGVAFYAQKGFTFEYSSTQDYYKGCVIIDPSDGQKYECIANMTAGTVTPHSDSSHTYWQLAGSSSSAVAYNTPYRGAELPYTWAELSTKVQNGDFSDLYIGDYVWVQLSPNDEQVICEIAGIDTYYNKGNPVLGHHIDFISRNCIATTYAMNNSNTNNGTNTSPYSFPWKVSALNYELNDSVSSIYSRLPSDLKGVIRPKIAYLEERYSSGESLASENGASWIGAGGNTGKLWIPSEIEVFGLPSWSEIGYGTSGFQQYPIFRLNPSKIIKKQGETIISKTTWWTLSAMANSSTDFCCVNEYGNADHSSPVLAHGVPICFTI